MRVSLIGMAGTGKSHWSAKLAGRGFRRFCCDDMIAEKLGPDLKRPDGSTMTMGQWMGFPYESGYEERASKYLTHEVNILSSLLDMLGLDDSLSNQNVVIDTTGSVIYTGEDLLERLKTLTTVVHLKTPANEQKKMLQAYVADPGPMLWHGIFSMRPGETTEHALARSYERLLLTRERLYAQYAHVAVDFHRRRQKGFDVDDLLADIAAGIC